MKQSIRIYKTSLSAAEEAEQRELKARWSGADLARVREAISSNKDLPQVFPQLKLFYAGKSVLVEDLRGVSLAQLKIGAYDLAYCALDYASFQHSRLDGTKLQYSRLRHVDFRSATLLKVQASPVDAEHADFTEARISASYFSHSNLVFAKSDGAQVADSDFIEASDILLTSPNQAIEMTNISYEEAPTIVHAVVGPSKMGTVTSTAKPGFVTVTVYAKPKTKSGGKVIERVVRHKIAGAVVAYSVGDTVLIRKVEFELPMLVKDIHAARNSTFRNRQPKARKWWITERRENREEFENNIQA